MYQSRFLSVERSRGSRQRVESHFFLPRFTRRSVISLRSSSSCPFEAAAHSRSSNRDRGEPRGSSPPTPPYIRVRIRRFGGLSGLVGPRGKLGRASARKAFGRAMVSAGLLLSRQGPCGLPAVCAAKSRPTPRRRSSAKRVRPRFHCFQAMARSRRLVHWSSVAQHRRSLAEAEVAAPSNQVDGQLLDDLRAGSPRACAASVPGPWL